MEEQKKNSKHAKKKYEIFRQQVLERARARALLESLERAELDMNVSKPWQIGRGIGVGDRVKRTTPMLAAKVIKEAERPLLVLGPLLLELEFDGKPAIDYAIEFAKAADTPVVATGHVVKGLLKRGFKPDAWMPVVNIIDRLRDPEWNGIRGEGQHDIVAFFGIGSTIASQGLSTLKQFAPHLKP